MDKNTEFTMASSGFQFPEVFTDPSYEYSGSEYIKVLAVDEDDAKEKAKEEACLDDIEIDHVSAAEALK